MRKERYGKAGRGPRAGAGGREKKGGEGPEQGVASLAVPEKKEKLPLPREKRGWKGLSPCAGEGRSRASRNRSTGKGPKRTAPQAGFSRRRERRQSIPGKAGKLHAVSGGNRAGRAAVFTPEGAAEKGRMPGREGGAPGRMTRQWSRGREALALSLCHEAAKAGRRSGRNVASSEEDRTFHVCGNLSRRERRRRPFIFRPLRVRQAPEVGPLPTVGRPHAHWREQRGRGRKRGLPVAERAGKSGLRGAGRRAEEAGCRTKRASCAERRPMRGGRGARDTPAVRVSCAFLPEILPFFLPEGTARRKAGSAARRGRCRARSFPRVPGRGSARKGQRLCAAEGWPELSRCSRRTAFAAPWRFRALRDDADEAVRMRQGFVLR